MDAKTDNAISDSDAFAASWDEPQKSALSQAELDKLTDDLIEALKTVTLQDFGPVYERLKGAEALPIEAVLPTDKVFTHGTQAYAAKGGRFAA